MWSMRLTEVSKRGIRSEVQRVHKQDTMGQGPCAQTQGRHLPFGKGWMVPVHRNRSGGGWHPCSFGAVRRSPGIKRMFRQMPRQNHKPPTRTTPHHTASHHTTPRITTPQTPPPPSRPSPLQHTHGRAQKKTLFFAAHLEPSRAHDDGTAQRKVRD